MFAFSKLNVSFFERQLSNGSKLFHFQRKNSPISIKASFLGGSRYDKKIGTAHFLEHMLVAGSKKFTSKNLLAGYIERIGGEFGARTNGDILQFNVHMAETSDLKVGIEVLREILCNPLFSEAIIESERGAILAEIGGQKSSPREAIWEVYRRLFYQKTPLAQSILGTPESVASITKADLLDFYSRYLTAGRLTYITSGDVDVDVIASALDASIAIPHASRLTPSPLPIIREVLFDEETYPGKQAHAIVGYRILPEDLIEEVALYLLDELLAVGRSARLVTELRYKQGLIYNLSSLKTRGPDSGVWAVQTACIAGNIPKVLDTVHKELITIASSGISEEELVFIKTKTIKSKIRMLQRSEAWVDFHAPLVQFETVRTIEDYFSALEHIGTSDIKRVAAKYLSVDPFVAICGDLKNVNIH